MKNTRSTKTALASSIFALMICFAMLLGTTYAWFTDSITSAGNIIKSGTLDVTMGWADGTADPNAVNWTDASTGAIFDYDKWEPGYTVARHIKISNEGTLALKYKVVIEATGEVSKLADVIDIYYLDPAAQIAERDDLINLIPLGTLADVLENLNSDASTAAGELVPEQSHTVTIVFKMKEAAGNEYQDIAIGASFSVKLLATQYAYEEDSFGNDYDANVQLGVQYISTNEALYNATVSGGKGELQGDIKITDADDIRYSGNRAYAVKSGADLTLDLGGHTLDYQVMYQNGMNTGYTYLFTTAYEGKLTVNGDGAINSANPEGLTCIIYAQGPSDVVINSGEFNTVNGICVWAGNNSKVTINGGRFISSGTTQEELIYSSGGVIDIYGGFFHNTEWEGRPINVANANRGTGFINIYGGTFVNFDPSTGGDDPNNIRVAEGYKVISEAQENGEIWYTVVEE